jgi:hypothetical protein
MKLLTKTEDLTFSQTTSIAISVIDWCEKNIGVNWRYPKPKITLLGGIIDNMSNTTYGEYCVVDNLISINLERNVYVRCLIKTVIHEYTHYLQPIRTKYHKLAKKHGYYDNPLEVEARYNEETRYKDCFKHLKKIIND